MTQPAAKPTEWPECPVCTSATALLDCVDLNKTCLASQGVLLPPAGIRICYVQCEYCGFAHAPDMYAWSEADFKTRIYNDAYVKVDPEYLELRPATMAKSVDGLFGTQRRRIRHLDWGGGNGTLSRQLAAAGWDTRSYDPFGDSSAPEGRFDLITAFEVFEHVPYPRRLLESLLPLLQPDSLLLFSTLLSDGHLQRARRLTWWYASPRNGHISLFSRDSLGMLAHHYGWLYASMDASLHAFFRGAPRWADSMFGNGPTPWGPVTPA